MMLKPLARVLGLAVLASAVLHGQGPGPSSCLLQPDKTVAVKPGAGRLVYCGLDLGSKTVKLSVLSIEKGRQPTTIRDERLCKRTLGLGTLAFDSKTNTAGAVPATAIADLVDTIREYQRICALDGGSIVAAGATQWARDATNVANVTARVKGDTGVTIDVLSPRQEAEYSYVAASVGARGRIVLDPGSNSFELAWQETGATTITSVLVPYGYVRGAANDIEPAGSYASGRTAYQAKVKAQLEAALGALNPPTSLAGLRTLVLNKKIGPEIIALGQDGAVHLSVRGLLRLPGGTWISDAPAYDALLARQSTSIDPAFGVMAATPITPVQVQSFLSSLDAADFGALTHEPARSLYGQKALVVPALVDLLFRELGATRLIMVPQEITTGHVLAKLPR